MADTGPRGPQGPAGTSIDLPVAIANGGTGATTRAQAVRGLANGGTLDAASNWDAVLDAGAYQIFELGSGAPSSLYYYGVLLVFALDAVTCQIYIPDMGAVGMAFRQMWNGSWREWRIVEAKDI